MPHHDPELPQQNRPPRKLPLAELNRETQLANPELRARRLTAAKGGTRGTRAGARAAGKRRGERDDGRGSRGEGTHRCELATQRRGKASRPGGSPLPRGAQGAGEGEGEGGNGVSRERSGGRNKKAYGHGSRSRNGVCTGSAHGWAGCAKMGSQFVTLRLP